MTEIEPIQLKSWLRFWRAFATSINDGIGRLARTLQADGVKLSNSDVSCTLMDAEFDRFASPHEETVARVRHGVLERPVTVTLKAGYKSIPLDLGCAPLMTQRATFIFEGAEHALLGQLARSPGVFLRRNESSAFAEVLSASGRAVRFRIADDRTTVSFDGRDAISWRTVKRVLDATGATSPKESELVTVLRALGLPPPTAGDKLQSNVEDLLDKIRASVLRIDLGELGRRQLDRRLVRYSLEPAEGSRLTLDVLESIAGLLRIFQDKTTAEAPNDDTWDLGNLRVCLIGDFLDHALEEWLSALRRRIHVTWQRAGGKPIGFGDLLIEANGGVSEKTAFTDELRRWSIKLPICQRIPPDGGSYVASAALSRRLTFNGPGGIKIGHKKPPRDFNWSHYGRLCPFDTPQSEDVGITLSVAAGARVNELGLVEAPCLRVESGKVTAKQVWLSPWDESDGRTGWIAFPDEREALVRGEPVYAHRGSNTLAKVEQTEVTHLHVSEEAMLSIAASLIPYRPHNDAVRVNMACNFLRQALPLVGATPPAVTTGAEERLPRDLPIASATSGPRGLAFGADLFVGYLPWKGWNFEDAIVISDSAAEVLTSLHFEHLPPVRLGRSLVGQETAFLITMKHNELEGVDIERFDTRGMIKEGAPFAPGEPYLLEPSVAWQKTRKAELIPYRGGDGKLGSAVVHRVETVEDEDGRGWISVVLRRARRAQAGDKLANRHGHKGVISRIVPDCEMPYVLIAGDDEMHCLCGESRRHLHLQILINPISVISRMNLGQLFETRHARSGDLRGLPDKLACFDPAGQEKGQCKLDENVLVGKQYVMKLDHNAEDKIHARSADPAHYSAFVQQPLGGRRNNGGQRLGEMEVWALQAHGVPHLLQEMLTLKSDNPWARRVLLADIASGVNTAGPELPEALRTFTAMCYGLGLDLVLIGRDEHRLDPALDRLPPDDARELRLGLLDQEVFLRTVSKGKVSSPLISGRNESTAVSFHPDGLESEVIFGPVEDFSCACGAHRLDSSVRRCAKCHTPLLPRRARRRRMAHIELAKPVPNPFFLFATPISFESRSLQPFRIAFDREAADNETSVVLSGVLSRPLRFALRTTFGGGPLSAAEVQANAATFMELSVRASDPFKRAVEAKLGASFRVPGSTESASNFGKQLAKLVAAQPAKPSGEMTLSEVITRLLPEVTNAGDEKSMAAQCSRVVNEILAKTDQCPVDFVANLLALDISHRRMLLDTLPVVPPDLRRVLKLRRAFQKNDLTIFYQRVLLADRDLQRSDPSNTEEYHRSRTEHMRAVSRLMCNQRLPAWARAWDPDSRRLRKSLSSILAGKEGLLIGHLLGKRVDFSGRAVIVPDPNLHIDTCRLPFALAIKLYRPLLLHHLHEDGETDGVTVLDRAHNGEDEAVRKVSSCLEALFAEYPVVLNRQPTLHRLGMLSFKPVLGSGSVIALPATVTAGFNADFDGDQMAVYLPLTEHARMEAERMRPSRHLWRPRDGRLALNLSQDIALGMWLAGRGHRAHIASEIESRPAEPLLLTQIETDEGDAFARVTQSGISFSIDDLEAFGKQCGSGDEADIARILGDAGDGNPVQRIVTSGSRGDAQVLAYLAGRRFADRPGSNLTLGLKLGERLELAQEGRRNVVNTKLATAEGGWLTKQLVAWGQHLCVTREDCKTTAGLKVTAGLTHGGLQRWIYGRVLAADCVPLGLSAGTAIGTDLCGKIQEWFAGDSTGFVLVRSPEHCEDHLGVCRACYGVPPWAGCGWSLLSIDQLVSVGTAVGLIAAQATGEPGTQMALRRKHLAASGQEDADEDVIGKFRGLFEAMREAWNQKSEYEASVAELDGHLVSQGIELSIVHLSTLLRGRQPELSRLVGWISRLADPGDTLEARLAKAALDGRTDSLMNPRSQAVIGGKSLEVRETTQ